MGCTGSGKGGLGRELARRTDGEIISIDSMKVYRRMDIGTAKPSVEIRGQIPHYLIDVAEPSEEFSVARYVELADRAIQDIYRRNKNVFVVGGTPLYIKALSEGLFEGPGADLEIRQKLLDRIQNEGIKKLYDQLQKVDPQAAGKIHINDQRRIVRALEVYEISGKPISSLQEQWDRQTTRYDCHFIGIRREREDQNHRTNERVRRMIDRGFVQEVQALLEESLPLGETARKAVGYAEMMDHLQDKCTLAEAVEMIKINTRHLAKSQRTWFKRFQNTDWIDVHADATVEAVADELIKRRGSLWSPSPK